jgi:hypothetical protein
VPAAVQQTRDKLVHPSVATVETDTLQILTVLQLLMQEAVADQARMELAVPAAQVVAERAKEIQPLPQELSSPAAVVVAVAAAAAQVL